MIFVEEKKLYMIPIHLVNYFTQFLYENVGRRVISLENGKLSGFPAKKIISRNF
jgi:hypothetical protein